MLIHVKIPHEPFNSAVRDGSAGKTLERILAETKPEAVYFTEYDGRRGAIIRNLTGSARPANVQVGGGLAASPTGRVDSSSV